MDIKEYIPGFLQGLTRVCISYPFDYVRIFLQINNKDNISTILKSNNLYRGLYIPLLSVPIDRLLGKSQTFHSRQRTGDIMARATDDTGLLSEMVVPGASLIYETMLSI